MLIYESGYPWRCPECGTICQLDDFTGPPPPLCPCRRKAGGIGPVSYAELQPLTTVISVRGRDRKALLADPSFAYVGRRMNRIGWPSSFWGNPYRVTTSRLAGAAAAVYEREIKKLLAMPAPSPGHALRGGEVLDAARVVAVKAELPTLRGKVLGCWCGTWRPGEPEIACHAVVLAKLANDLSFARTENAK
jgi:hypothetical protein